MSWTTQPSGIVARDLKDDDRLVSLYDGRVVIIRGRKSDDSGWWLQGMGGLCDNAIETVYVYESGKSGGWRLERPS